MARAAGLGLFALAKKKFAGKIKFVNLLRLGIRGKMGIEEEGSNNPKSLTLSRVTGGDIGMEEE